MVPVLIGGEDFAGQIIFVKTLHYYYDSGSLRIV